MKYITTSPEDLSSAIIDLAHIMESEEVVCQFLREQYDYSVFSITNKEDVIALMERHGYEDGARAIAEFCDTYGHDSIVFEWGRFSRISHSDIVTEICKAAFDWATFCDKLECFADICEADLTDALDIIHLDWSEEAIAGWYNY